ncbi:TonB-dependent receptor [Massilia sp. 9096]|uniref:TonB-dependent receptor n=1 Tax=Massilia sp. 9096 TaxID=1500894 RepID=UPI00056C559C|nr:TonB-dependent receptor [Massilia sp. 9096]
MKNQRGRLRPRLLALAVSGVAAGTAYAQALPPSDGIQEVIVTAQRIAAPQSSTPVAMSVVSAEELDKLGLDTPGALSARLPNTYLENSYDGLRITIRGVSSNDPTEKGDPSAAFMIDGVTIARPQSQNAALFDVDRIEVLRGPQGTLYGRNTTAGVVNVITRAPVDRFEGAAAVTLGDYATRKVEAMVNVPVNDALALRAALSANRHDPYLRNGQGSGFRPGLDRDDRAARLSAKLNVNRDASLLVRLDASHDDTNNDSAVPDTNFYRGIDAGQPAWYGDSTRNRLTNRYIAPNIAPQQGFSHKTTAGLSAELNWDLGPATLTWVGSHRRFEHDYLYNYYYRVVPGLALGVVQPFHGDYVQNSHELRLASHGGGPFSVQGGLYWFHERTRDNYDFQGLAPIGLPPHYVFDVDPVVSSSRAVFGQATYELVPGLRASAGARATHDEKSHDTLIGYQQAIEFNPATDLRQPDVGTLSTNKTTWRLGLDYDLAPATLLYGSVATGYKAGGFNDGCAVGTTSRGAACLPSLALPASSLFYQPETVRAYEAGLKTRFWHRRASLNLAAFYYDYRNLQLSSEIVQANGSPAYETTNAGQAAVRGLEADGQALLGAADRITYALTLLDAHYSSYTPDGVHSWAGVKLDRAPSRTLSLGYEHHWMLAGGRLTGGVDTRLSGSHVLTIPSQLLVYRIPGHSASDLRLAWEPAGTRWGVQARVRNLENEVRPLTIGGTGLTVPSDPRTADVRLDYRF